MATPFQAFRKYTGPMMAVLCGFLMLAFVVADPLMQYLGSGGGGGRNPRAGETVALWRGGEINERQLGEAVFHRRLLAEFQRNVFNFGLQDAQRAGAGDLPLRVQPLMLPATREEGVERSVVQTKIFAQKAQDAGMIVTDEMVNDYLQAIGRDRVSVDQMRLIVGRLTVGGRTATISFIFDLMREAMLARNYLSSHQYAFSTVLPEEQWEDWLKVNQRVVIEASPVTVEDFVDQVSEPSEVELAEYFEEFREVEPTPDILTQYGDVELPRPTPAFATPKRVKMQYAVLEFETILEETLDEVTEEEIETYYNDNKEQFIKADEGLFGGEGLFGEEETSEEESTETTEEKPTDEITEEETPAEDSLTGAEETAEETAIETTEETPVDESVEDASQAGEPTEEEEEEEEEQTTAGTSEEAIEETTQENAEETSEGETAQQEQDDYQSLEEVSEDIRRVLAQSKTAEKIRDQAMALKSELDLAFDEYFDAILDAEDAGQELPEPPAALADLKQFAEEHGLRHGLTGERSYIELREDTFGRSQDADQTAVTPMPICIRAFREGLLDLYEPAVSYDRDANIYLSVITERLDAIEPELGDVREQIVDAWKRARAAELALEHAKKLAEEAEASGKSLQEHFIDSETQGVVVTDPFSFLEIANISPTTGQVFLQLSQPAPLVAPGPELLSTVLSLDDSQVGAALNHDHSVAYVLRLAARLDSIDQLRTKFLTDGRSWIGMREAVQNRFMQNRNALTDDLLDASELEWMREADQIFEE